MSENTPDLNLLRSQLAYQVEYTNCQGDIFGEFIGRFLESESKLRMAEKGNKSIAESLSSYKKRNDDLKREVEEMRSELEAAESNVKAFEDQNNDLRKQVEALRVKKQEITNQRQQYQETAGKFSEEIFNLKQLLEDQKKGMKRGKRSQA